MSGVRIEVDRERCIGAARCVRYAPGAFTQDDEGLVVLLPEGRPDETAAQEAAAQEPAAQEAAVREAAAACPVRAITVR